MTGIGTSSVSGQSPAKVNPAGGTATSAGGTPSATSAKKPSNEDALRAQLIELHGHIRKREPLQHTYKHLLMSGPARKPLSLPKDKFYRRVGSRLRERVEKFCHENQGKDPWDRLRQRPPTLDEEKMRAALTLREHKDYEQKPLMEAYMAALPKRQGMTEEAARRHLEGVAYGLQHPKWRQQRAAAAAAASKAKQVPAAVAQTEAARQAAELERQRQQAQEREEARRQRQQEEEEERLERQAQLERQSRPRETPNQVLQRFYKPIFDMLWNLEFDILGGSNPFRMVIDRGNCAALGAPDYFDIIQEPMNLTYIQQKVERSEYNTLQPFVRDVNLMLANALKYNSDTGNPYHVAALQMKRKFDVEMKKLVATLKQKQRGKPN